jgi:hypothetical protein
MNSHPPSPQHNFWCGRTIYLCKEGLKCVAKVHDLTDTLVTFTLIMLERQHLLAQTEMDYYKPGHTYTVAVGNSLRIRTLDDTQRANVAQLKPIVTVGTWKLE